MMVKVEFENMFKDGICFLLPTVAIGWSEKAFGVAWLFFSITISF